MPVKQFLDSNPNPIEQGYIFTLLPEKAGEVYRGYVKKAADTVGLKCESFLDLKQPTDALKDILARIQKAEILIFDITDYTPNVMWELGVGLSLKDAERVIVIREESTESLPFNIYTHRVSFNYDPKSEESLNALRETLIDVLRNINRASGRKPEIKSPEVKALLGNALKAVDDKQWLAADALFQTMDMREPDNWYIHNQWGIMHRTKGEFDAASDKFNQALNYTAFEDQRAYIYTELAVLHQMNRKYRDAEDWFKKAEKADSENNRLYIAWAEYHDELGDYFSAQAKINSTLGRLRETDPEYKDFRLRHAYYDYKINDRSYKKNFEQFLREGRHGRPNPQPPSRSQQNGNRMPYDISWDDLVNNYMGEVVEGDINNVTELGLFVSLCGNYTGLVFWKNLQANYGEKFSKHQPIKVKINEAYIDRRTQKNKIDLRLVE